MYRSDESGRRVLDLAEAFKSDGWKIKKMVTRFGRTGIKAESKKAFNYDTGKRKRLYYIEGNGYEMGFLMGSLAEEDISAMAMDFADRVVFSFIGARAIERIKLLQEVLIRIVYELSRAAYKELPQVLKDEIQGIYDGCKSVNPKTRVNLEHLIVLNIGIDVLCSMIYSGNFHFRNIPDLEPYEFKIPIMCNAFSVFGDSAGGGHYFGRDFMFPTADVFQNTASMVIYNPTETEGKRPLRFVGMTAPGMVGSISAMNVRGVGIGVNMSPAGNCSPGSIGTNSLLLARICAQYGDSAENMVELIKNTQRGVSWNYIVADGENDRACVVEAGSSVSDGVKADNSGKDSLSDRSTFVKYASVELLPYLPNIDFLDKHKSAKLEKGIMVRWNDFEYPEEYLSFNQGLWQYYNTKHSANKTLSVNKTLSANKTLYEDALAETGFINKDGGDSNCPSTFYFAPQRERNRELVIVTNHFIIPEMRYFSMLPWTSKVVGNIINDIQWRYDELNREIAEVLDNHGTIGMEEAKLLISFLSPYGRFPAYYAGNPRSKDGKEIRIEGAVSVFDLKSKVVESHYGYYCDQWVKVTLQNYF